MAGVALILLGVTLLLLVGEFFALEMWAGLDGDDAALVIAVACGAGAADHLVAVGLEAGGEPVHLLSPAQAEGQVDVAQAGEGGGLLLRVRLAILAAFQTRRSSI